MWFQSWRAYAGAVGVVVLLAGCAAPPNSPPTGIDGLVIPAPTVDPENFVPTLASPWVVPAGETTSLVGTDGRFRVTISLGEPQTIAGLTATPLRLQQTPGLSLRITGEVVWWLAQDTRGHVWVVGADVSGAFGSDSWRAGAQGAQAGLLVPAEPRVGDGYEFMTAGTRVEVVATERVSAYDATLAEACGTCVELVLTDGSGARTLVLRSGEGVVEWTDPRGISWSLA